MTGSWDKTIILWDLANRGNKLATFTGHTEVVNCLRMKKDTLVSCSSDNSLRIWNLNFQDNQPSSKSLVEPIEPIVLNGHISDVNCCEIYDNYIASGGSDSLIIIWNFEGQLLFKLEGHLGCVRNLYMDDYKLVSGGDAKRIMVWDYKVSANN
jgi:F-box/WD-40 domain protein 7